MPNATIMAMVVVFGKRNLSYTKGDGDFNYINHIEYSFLIIGMGFVRHERQSMVKARWNEQYGGIGTVYVAYAPFLNSI